MPAVVYIHGRGQKGDPDTERKKWYEALTSGLACLAGQTPPNIPDDDRFTLAYWSDVFYPPKNVPNAASAENPQGLGDLQRAVIDRITGHYWQLQQRLPPPPIASQPVGTLPGTAAPAGSSVSNIWTVPASVAEVKSAQYEDSFVRDVVKYVALGYADKVRVPLVNILTDLVVTDGKVMLVSHSFGTIISFDVLVRSLGAINSNRQKGLNSQGKQDDPKPPLVVDTWVTMGCPLGWALDLQHRLPVWAQSAAIGAANLENDLADAATRAVDVLKGLVSGLHSQAVANPFASEIIELGIKQFPPDGVMRWLNIYDPHDPVAFPPVVGTLGAGEITVGSTFLSQGKKRAFDVQILNDFDLQTDFNILDLEAHNDVGYGQCAQLAQLVADFWSRCS